MTEPSKKLPLLPQTWSTVRVDEVFVIQQGKQVSKKNRIGNNQRPFLRTRNVFWGRLDLSDLDHMHFSVSDEERLALKKGDLLLCEGGDVGRTAVWQNQVPRCYYQNHLHRLRTANEKIDPEFALYWFWYAFELSKIYFGRKNVTTIPNMSKSRLAELPMPKPLLSEQQKIAALLLSIQRAIEQQERLIALTTELKKVLMHKLFTEGTRGEKQKQTEIGPVPESWDVVPIGGLGTCVTGSTPRTAVKENYCPPERDFIAPADLGQTKYIYESERQISVAGLATVRPLPRDSLLCVCIGSSLGKTGMTYKVESCTNQQINAIICDKSNNANFVYYLLTYHSDYWRNHATFGTVPILSKGRFCQVRVPYTSNQAEQEDIASALVACDVKLEYYMSKLKKYQELFNTLLHQLMTAQIRVNNLDLTELDYEPITTGREEVI